MRIALLSLSFLFACSSPPSAVPERTGGPLVLVPEPVPGTATPARQDCAAPDAAGKAPAAGQGGQGDAKAEPADKAADKAADEREQKLKDKRLQLQQKQRELDYAKVEQQAAAIDRKTRELSVAAALARARVEVDKAERALQLFRSIERPKELEERQIAHQYAVNNADQAKDELAELEAMYQAEEFAKATKELVLKRGRQRLQLAERSLAVSKTELTLLKEHTLPDKERELARKLDDARLDLQKAELEADKAKLELALGERKAADRQQDLQREIGELQREVDELAKGQA